MHGIDFIQDLAVIMLIAGIVTVLFHRLKQPVVLGYIVAGVIIGPHTPPFALVRDEPTINVLAELGVVFLLFSLGLEFSLRKLARVGVTAVVAALAEIILMIWIGYMIGGLFGWKPMDALFLGAIMAESRQLRTIERLIEPIRDMFSAIFFVAIGLLLDPKALVAYAGPIAVITAAVVFGKVLSCGLGAFVAGQDGRTAMRVGMGLAQIGEFSFIIASLGVTLKVTSGFLYPIAVAVSAFTTFLTPYLIRLSDPLSAGIAAALPERVTRVFALYTTWLRSIQPQGDRAELARIVRRSVLQVLVNFALVAAIFLAGGYVAVKFAPTLGASMPDQRLRNAAVWGAALIVSLPFLVAAYRKLGALSLLLAELGVKPELAGQYTDRARRVVAEIIPIAALVVIMLLIATLSASILPPAELLVLVLSLAAGLVALLWRWVGQLPARLQIALRETLSDEREDD